MNFSQLQERVRGELLRRIDRGTLSVSLLSRQTAIGQPHLSNFLHARRNLSFTSLDKILTAQHLTIEDLIPQRRAASRPGRDLTPPIAQLSIQQSSQQSGALPESDLVHIPLVFASTAIHEPYMRASSTRALIPVLSSFLVDLKPDAKAQRLQWDRYVAIRLPDSESAPMHPLLTPNSILILDRHNNILRPHRAPESLPAAQAEPPPALYAVRSGSDLKIRYASLIRGRILLRPHNLTHPIEIPEPAPGETYHDLIAGKVILILRPS